MKTSTKITLLEIAAVFVFYLVTRLPNLGYDTFNTDVWKWKARTYDFGSGVFTLNFEKTMQKYHPGVSLMWIGTAAVKGYNLYYDVVYKHPPVDNDVKTVFELNFVQKLCITIVLGFVFCSIYYMLGVLFGRKYAVISIFLIFLEPFNVALTREIHLEGLMSAFLLASFIWFYGYLEYKESIRRLIVSGVFGALAVLTKTSALFIVAFIPVLTFLYYYLDSKRVGLSMKLAFGGFYKWVLVFATAFVIIWPAMWVTPAEAITTLYKGIFTVGLEEGHEQLYFGVLVDDPGIGFYYVVLILRSSLYLLVGLLGYVAIAKKAFDSRTQKFILITFLFALLYFLEISLSSKKLDRYLLPSMLSLLLVAAVFYEWLITKAKEFWFLSLLWIIAPAALLLYKYNPDYFSYYSPIIGGSKNGINILEPKWMLGQTAIKDYFLKLRNDRGFAPFALNESMDNLVNSPLIKQRLTVGFPEKYYTQIWPFIELAGGKAVIKDLTPHAVKTKFFVYPVWQDDASKEDRFKLKYIDSIYERNVELYKVYERIE